MNGEHPFVLPAKNRTQVPVGCRWRSPDLRRVGDDLPQSTDPCLRTGNAHVGEYRSHGVGIWNRPGD